MEEMKTRQRQGGKTPQGIKNLKEEKNSPIAPETATLVPNSNLYVPLGARPPCRLVASAVSDSAARLLLQ